MTDLLNKESSEENPYEATYGQEETPVETPKPSKYDGKEKDDVIAMYENLQKEHSRQANELGQNRKTIDQFLELQLSQTQQASQSVEQLEHELEFTDLIDEPQAAIDRLVQKRLDSGLSKTNETVNELKTQLEQAKFEKKYPNWAETAGSTEFQEWVLSQPYRVAKWKAADNYDFNSFEELLTSYSEVASLRSPNTSTADKDALRKKQLADATLERGNNGATFSRPFIRAEVMKLKSENPTAYYAPEYQAALKQAYLDGRVK